MLSYLRSVIQATGIRLYIHEHIQILSIFVQQYIFNVLRITFVNYFHNTESYRTINIDVQMYTLQFTYYLLPEMIY